MKKIMKDKYFITFFVFAFLWSFSITANADVLTDDDLDAISPQIAKVKVIFDVNAISELIKIFENISTNLKGFAIWIFTTLLVLNILLTAIKNFLQQDNISIKSIAGDMAWTILCAIMFYTLFIGNDYLIDVVYKGFEGLFISYNPDPTVISKFKDLATPQNIILSVVNVISKTFSAGFTAFGFNVGLWIFNALCSLIFLLLAFMSILILFMIYVEFWIVFSLSMFFLMFYTLPQTRDIAMRFVFYCLSISSQLFVGSLFLVGILSVVLKINVAFNFGSSVTLIFLGLVAYFGVQKIPEKIASLFGNHSSSSAISSVTAGLVAGTANQALASGKELIQTAGGAGGLFAMETLSNLGRPKKEGGDFTSALGDAATSVTKSIGQSLKESTMEKLTGTPKHQNVIGKMAENVAKNHAP